MFDELRDMAARRLAKRPKHERVEFQAQLDRWNALAAAWTIQCRLRPMKAVKRQFRLADLRRRAEWAFMDQTVKDVRLLANALERMLRQVERTQLDPGAGDCGLVLLTPFPAMMEALAEDFDRREYAAMMRAFEDEDESAA
jgi:hypothetical protein